MSSNSWIDEKWSRDWLFWIGTAVAAVGVALSIAFADRPLWAVIVSGLGLFAFTVAFLGFARTMFRSYRGE